MPTTVNYTNFNVDVISNEIATIPRSTTKTGTIATAANSVTIHGTNTLFLAELKVGNWLCDTTNYEVRRIRAINSDTVVIVDQPFSNVLTTTAVKTIDVSDLFSEVYAMIKSGDTDGKVDGKTMANGVPYLASVKSSIQVPYANKVDPITFDATSTNIYITTIV